MTASGANVPPIVAGPAEATAAWFSELFAPTGAGEVRSVRSEPVGTGQMAHNERFFLRWTDEASAAAAGAPATVVGKFPSPSPESREAGARGAYLKEVNFYRMIAGTVDVRTPKAHYAEATADSTAFTLILEDLAPAVQGDQLAGCTIEDAHAAIVNLAGLHGPRWNDTSLLDYDWLQPDLSEDGLVFLDAIYNDYTRQFIERYDNRLTDEHRRVLTSFAERITSWATRPLHCRGLVHGDYRLDNLLFDGSFDDRSVSAVDWQTVGLTSPGNDLAYFLGNGVDPALRRSHEASMIELYHETLCERWAVVNYSLEQCQHDYREGAFHGPLITVLGAISVGETERGNDMFLTMIDRSVHQILDQGSLEALRDL